MSDSFTGERRYNQRGRERILKAQRGVCMLCSEPLDIKDASVDHHIPRAIAKWLEPLISEKDYDELRAILNDNLNVMVVHHSCNMRKGGSIGGKYPIGYNPIERLFLDGLLASADRFVKLYEGLVDTLYIQQRGACAVCGTPINRHCANIRRLNVAKPRTIDNAVLIHNGCNKRFSCDNRNSTRV